MLSDLVAQNRSDCESTDLARVYRWTRGRVKVGQCLEVRRSCRQEWHRGPDRGEGTRRCQAHEVLLPLGAATTVTPVWTEPLGAARTVTTAWGEPLGAATTGSPVHLLTM